MKLWKAFALVTVVMGAAACFVTPEVAPDPLQCGDVTCASGLACCNESCGICTPVGGQCADIVCDDDYNCADVDCGAGAHCEMVEVQCVAPPCDPIPNCVPDEELQPSCDGVVCGAGLHCEMVQPTCATTAPCYPAPQCVPDPGVPCGDVNCAPGLVCCNESCGICTPPGAFCTQQVCTP